MKKILLLLGGLFLLFTGAYSLPVEGIPYSKLHTADFGLFEARARTPQKLHIPAPLGWMLVLAGAALSLSGAYAKRS